MKYFYLAFVYLIISQNAFAEIKTKAEATTYDITGEAQILSQLLVKGLAYSDTNPAMNASFLLPLGEQVKLGVWSSNISNLSAADDNFWFKFVGEFKFDINNNTKAFIYINDNHFYKSNQRNGQNIVFDINYKNYEFGFEWISNFEGTKTNAEYLKFEKLFEYKKDFKWGGNIGFTNSHSSAIKSYLDIQIKGQYIFNSVSNAEIGVTANSNESQFGARAKPAIYFGFKINY